MNENRPRPLSEIMQQYQRELKEDSTGEGIQEQQTYRRGYVMGWAAAVQDMRLLLREKGLNLEEALQVCNYYESRVLEKWRNDNNPVFAPHPQKQLSDIELDEEGRMQFK